MRSRKPPNPLDRARSNNDTGLIFMTTELAKIDPSRPLASVKDLSAFLNKSKQAIELALPKHLNPDRMLRIALTCFSTNPDVRKCSAQSILASIVVASQIGLEPGINGQGYLIPYKNTCTFVPGWQGLVGLLNNSGRATAWTGAVFEGDEWDFQLGSQPRCKHVPGDNYGDETKLRWVYACGKVNGSEMPVIEAWPIARVWKRRDQFNKVGTSHYSFKHPEMYARKAVLLQVLKYMPRSIELQNAMTAANAAEDGRSSRVEDGVVIEMEDAPEERSAKRPETKPRESAPTTARAEFAQKAEAAGLSVAECFRAMLDLEMCSEPNPDDVQPGEWATGVSRWNEIVEQAGRAGR